MELGQGVQAVKLDTVRWSEVVGALTEAATLFSEHNVVADLDRAARLIEARDEIKGQLACLEGSDP